MSKPSKRMRQGHRRRLRREDRIVARVERRLAPPSRVLFVGDDGAPFSVVVGGVRYAVARNSPLFDLGENIIELGEILANAPTTLLPPIPVTVSRPFARCAMCGTGICAHLK